MTIFWNFIKKYWFIIVSFLGALLAVFVMTKDKDNRGDVKVIKKDIKQTDKDIKDVKQRQDKIKKDQEEEKFLLEALKQRAHDLENQKGKAPKNTNAQKAKDKLKKIARG